MIFHSRFINWSEHNLLKRFKANGWEASLTNWKHVRCDAVEICWNKALAILYVIRYSFIWLICLIYVSYVCSRCCRSSKSKCVTMLERISSGVCICIVMQISNRTINHCACPADIIIIETGEPYWFYMLCLNDYNHYLHSARMKVMYMNHHRLMQFYS